MTEDEMDRWRWLTAVLYAAAVLCSATTTFGPYGLLLGSIVVGVWTFVYTSRNRGTALLNSLLVLFLCYMMMLSPYGHNEAYRREHCRNSLKQIGLALHNYHDVYKCFPPAYVADESGKPMHSWRVLILPYIEATDLYKAYDFSEPWDGPNNSKLASQMPKVYRCPSQQSLLEVEPPSTRTDYVAVTGPKTAWPGAVGRKIAEITDGTSNTVLVLESGRKDVHWMAPYDISVEEATTLLQLRSNDLPRGHRREDFFKICYIGRNAAFCDGSVHFFTHVLEDQAVKALLSVNDGEFLDEDDWYNYQDPGTYRQRKVGNVVRLSVFLFLTVLPLPGVICARPSNRD